jgi:hypothetical protein
MPVLCFVHSGTPMPDYSITSVAGVSSDEVIE